MEFNDLLIEQDGPVSEVIINRPGKLNILSRRTILELSEAFCSLENDAATRAVVVTGAGERSFSAGADIAELRSADPARAREISLAGQKVFRKIETLKKPVIAMINGCALGGGCELAMSCHLRYGSDKAVLGQPEIDLGALTGFAGSQRLPRLVGRGRALELLLLGEPISADKAREIGLLNGVFGAGELRERTFEIARKLCLKAPKAVSSMIEAVVMGTDMAVDEGGRLESSLFGKLFSTEDLHEGMEAFLEKRKPSFSGR